MSIICSIICENSKKCDANLHCTIVANFILWGTPYLAQKLDDCRAAYMSGIRKPFFPYGKEGQKIKGFAEEEHLLDW